MILNNIETLPQEKLQELQLNRLKTQLNTVYNNCPLYKRSFDQNKADLNIKKIEDLTKFPLLTDEIIIENTVKNKDIFGGRQNIDEDKIWKLFSNDKFPYVEGSPFFYGYSENDFQAEINILKRMLVGCGIRQEDFVHAIILGMDPITYSIYQAILKLGCRYLGGLAVEIDIPRIVDSMRLKPNCLITPFAMLMAASKHAKKAGFDEATHFLNYQKVLVHDIIWETKRAEKLQRKGWKNAEFFNFRKINIPGFYACECEKHDGLHYPQDSFIAEIVDPENTNELVAEGERGQLLVTTITREASPCIRYTPPRPLYASKNVEKCDCGRTIARIKFLK